MARSARPSELSESWRNDGIRVEIDDGKLSIVAKRGMRRELDHILNRIARQAKVIVARPGNHPYSTTKRMLKSIHRTRIKGVNKYAVSGTVEAGGPIAPYTKFVHEGTKRHVIRARPENPTGLLRFYWARPGSRVTQELRQVTVTGSDGRSSTMQAAFDVETPYRDRMVRVPSVMHPGSRPKPFLVKAAADVTGYKAVRRR